MPLEKSLVELAQELELKIDQGELLIGMYMEDGATFQDLIDHAKNIQKIQGEIQNLVVVSSVRFYGRCRNARNKKNIAELGYEVDHEPDAST